MPMQLEHRKIARSMTLSYFVLWGAQFIGFAYLPIYLNELGYANNLVGLVVAFAYITSMVSQPIWGSIADRAKTKNKVLLIALVCVAVSAWLLIIPRHTSLFTLLPSIAVLYAVMLVPGILVDTIVVENIQKTNLRFGSVKCFSSGGAAFMAFLTYLISLFMVMKASSAFMLLSGAAALSIIPIAFLPKTHGHAHTSSGPRVGMGTLLKNKRMMLLLAFALFHFTSVQCANTFLSVYYSTEQGLNAGVGAYGLFFAICIALETIVMMTFTRAINKLNIYHVFVLAGLAGGIRSLIVFVAPNIYVMMFCAIFHALMFGPLWVRLAPYIRSIVPAQMRATGMAAWSLVVFGLAPVLGSLLGGALSGLVGIRNLFLVTAILLFVTTMIFAVLFQRQRAVDLLEGFATVEE
ncbi:MAG: MFS transporter [Eubacteriales bacterium]|nr:MFS transporter [Eubacteriales bacterium]